MSELKAISGHEIREDIDYNTRGIDPEDKEWHNYGKELCDTLYYHKSEADKVIAEKDAEIARLKAIRKVHVEAIESMGAGLLQDEDKIRHSKYKRCLAMAKWCDSENYTACWYHENSERCEWTEKWHKRWLELAERFKDKEAK